MDKGPANPHMPTRVERLNAHLERAEADSLYGLEDAVADDVAFRAAIALRSAPDYCNLLRYICAASHRTEREQEYFQLGFGYTLFTILTALQKADNQDMESFRELVQKAKEQQVDWDWALQVLRTMAEGEEQTFRPVDE